MYSFGFGIAIPSYVEGAGITCIGLYPGLPSANFSDIVFLGLPPVPGIGPLFPMTCPFRG